MIIAARNWILFRSWPASLARQAISDKRPVVLRAMSAYERGIVHMELAGNEQVKTESIGEGEERKVVIKPIGSIEQGNNSESL